MNLRCNLRSRLSSKTLPKCQKFAKVHRFHREVPSMACQMHHAIFATSTLAIFFFGRKTKLPNLKFLIFKSLNSENPRGEITKEKPSVILAISTLAIFFSKFGRKTKLPNMKFLKFKSLNSENPRGEMTKEKPSVIFAISTLAIFFQNLAERKLPGLSVEFQKTLGNFRGEVTKENKAGHVKLVFLAITKFGNPPPS